MHNARSNFHPSLLALIALVVAMAIPAAALAQNPVVDQYAPTVPTPDGPEAPPEPDTNSGSGGFGGDEGGTSAGSGSTGGGTGGDAPADAVASPTSQEAAPTTSESVAATGAGDHRDKQTLDGLAAGSERERQTPTSPGGDDRATDLVSGGSGADTATVVFLWSVLGVTALWAVATLVRRRRDEDGHPA